MTHPGPRRRQGAQLAAVHPGQLTPVATAALSLVKEALDQLHGTQVVLANGHAMVAMVGSHGGVAMVVEMVKWYMEMVGWLNYGELLWVN